MAFWLRDAHIENGGEVKNFWRSLMVQIIVRACSSFIIWVSAKGYLTTGQAEYAAVFVATILVNVGIDTVTRLLARWHWDLARLTMGLTRTELDNAASTVSPITKILEAAKPGGNPAALRAAVEADEAPIERPR